MTKTAMILSAGRGERLKPITNALHKSLCQVKGKPLIEHHLFNLAQSGFSKIIINHAYLGDQLRKHLGDGSKWNVKIHYSPEPPGGLETGGGIKNALHLLGNEPFLTVNADIYTDFNFSRLTKPKDVLAHLILINNPSHNLKGDFDLDKENFLLNERRFTFMGIAWYDPFAFNHAPYGRYSVVEHLIRPLTKTKKISGEVFNGLWIDIGSPDRLQFANGG